MTRCALACVLPATIRRVRPILSLTQSQDSWKGPKQSLGEACDNLLDFYIMDLNQLLNYQLYQTQNYKHTHRMISQCGHLQQQITVH